MLMKGMSGLLTQFFNSLLRRLQEAEGLGLVE